MSLELIIIHICIALQIKRTRGKENRVYIHPDMYAAAIEFDLETS